MENPDGISVAQLFAMLVLRMRLSPSYVLDEMTEYELQALLENSHYAIDKDGLEMQRLQTWVTARCSGSNISLTDIMKFSWEEQAEEAKPVTAEQMETLRNKAKELKKYINAE